MATTKQLVCLANSRKHNGRCVAGIEIGSKNWIRPVSSRSGHEVSASERQYQGGAEPEVLDVISVRLVAPRPVDFQRENWLLDPTFRWLKKDRISWDELCLLKEHPTSLWINGYDSSAGTNDRVPTDQKDTLKDSLKLIQVDRVVIKVLPAHPMSNNTTPTVRALFQHAGSQYTLRVTDPVYEEKFRTKGFGNYRLGDSFLTVSLSEEFDGYFYKLVAAVVERTNVGSGW